MGPAMLGGVPGVAEVRSRHGNGSRVDCRGTFAFGTRYGTAMVELFEAGKPVEFVGLVAGEPARLDVRLMSLAAESGTVFFEGTVDRA